VSRRLFNRLSAISFALFVVLYFATWTQLTDRNLAQQPATLPYTPQMTVTSNGNTWTFTYHDYARSTIHWRYYKFFGFRVPPILVASPALILPICWVLIRVKSIFSDRKSADSN
jgi:hypothetical protein